MNNLNETLHPESLRFIVVSCWKTILVPFINKSTGDLHSICLKTLREEKYRRKRTNKEVISEEIFFISDYIYTSYFPYLGIKSTKL